MMTPGYNWGYKTIPQEQLNRREIDYSRGKGLGGSTAINYCVYTRGPEADYEHWADVVGDDNWRWKNVLQRFKKVGEGFERGSCCLVSFAKGWPRLSAFTSRMKILMILFAAPMPRMAMMGT